MSSTCLIAARELGDGPPLVLLHELGLAGDMFRPFADELAAHFRVVIPDLRGHGLSEDLGCPHTIAQLAADVADLLGLLEVSQAAVLGYGSGGLVAQQLAHDRPELTSALVLVCSSARHDPAAQATTPAPGLLRRLGDLTSGEGGPARLAAGLLHRHLSGADGKQTELAEAIASFDSTAWLPSLRQPTLVVVARNDTVLSPSAQLELSELIPGADTASLPADHDVALTHERELAELVGRWLVHTSTPRADAAPRAPVVATITAARAPR